MRATIGMMVKTKLLMAGKRKKTNTIMPEFDDWWQRDLESMVLRRPVTMHRYSLEHRERNHRKKES